VFVNAPFKRNGPGIGAVSSAVLLDYGERGRTALAARKGSSTATCQEKSKKGMVTGLTKAAACPIITVKSEPRTRLAPQVNVIVCGKATKSTVTLQEWRLSF
jgi:hypothetical protein